jgi:orotate phosphoribosyltransferase
MLTSLEIRSAESGDLNRLIELYRHLHPADDSLPDGPGREHLWTAMLARPGFHCLVAFHGDVLVASCCLAVIPNLTRGGRPYGLIENVVTHADFRRRGFGKAVLARALDLAWQLGCYKVMLLTGSKRPETHHFYHACGFRSGEKTGFVARPDARDRHAVPSASESHRALANTIAARSRLNGVFRLRSGARSTEYFDKYQFESDPALLGRIAERLASMVSPGTEMLAGLELGGVPIATALSLHTGLPVVFVRKVAKSYGTCRLAEGGHVGDRRLLVVEDVVTSGGQVVESCLALRALGALVEQAICVIDREAGGAEALRAVGVQLTPLFHRRELE